MKTISKVTIIGYEKDLNKKVYRWALHNDNKTVIGLDEYDRIILLVPRHLCIIEYIYKDSVQEGKKEAYNEPDEN